MNKKLALETGICAISLPVAVFFAHDGYGRILWIYAALVAGLGIIWVLQGFFRKSNENANYHSNVTVPNIA